LETDSADLVTALGSSSSDPLSDGSAEPPVCRLQILVERGESKGTRWVPPPVARSRGHLLSLVSDRDNYVHCDLNQGFAFGCLHPDLAADHEFSRYYFLDAAVLTMLQHRFLVPIHAALVVRNGRGLLLCGDSTAGKSTLAYACARAGFTLVSDNAVYLQRSRRDAYALGDPTHIRLRAPGQILFPELARFPLELHRNGKAGYEIATSELGIETAPAAAIDTVLFLDRWHDGNPKLDPIAPFQAHDWLKQTIFFGDPAVRCEQERCVLQVIQKPLYRFSYRNLDSAVRRLEALTDATE
jgi:hypothetical protein